MSLISVDTEKCKRDGICVETCPAKILKLIDQDSVPVQLAGADEL